MTANITTMGYHDDGELVTMSSLERVDRDDWQSSAACAGEMGSVFYPPLRPERKAARASRERRAKAVCASCPVRVACLEQAVRRNERYGIWGGLTDKERRLAAEPVA
ncbi:WhiB family transcriptional regulator [Ilumatobacter sp.]|uniref:WhiB family transcriptional regulator n=1 Tax=Ilumatobacter sp. TaxID=1967498 RepID=UPI003C774018